MMKTFCFSILLIVAGLLALCVSSCSDEDSRTVFLSHDMVTLSISATGVIEDDNSNELSRSNENLFEPLSVNIPIDSSMVMHATLERAQVTRSVTSLAVGTKYRVIVFKQGSVTDAGYVCHADFAVGATLPIAGYLHVPAGITYTFVCYSLNSVTSLPVFTKSILVDAINPITNDLLYTRFDQNISSANEPLSFCFRRQFSQITVIADATCMKQNITAISASLLPNYSALLDLGTGTLTRVESTVRIIPWGIVTAGQTVTSTPCTVFTNGSNAIRLNIPSVTIGNITKTDLTAFWGSNVMQPGSRYILRLKFVASSGNSDGISGGGVTWSPGNLIGVTNEDGSFSFHFAPAQESYSGDVNGGDYFCWNTLNPYAITSNNITGNYELSTDPCSQVFPQGTWRMPTADEFRSLINSGSVWATKNGKNGLFFGTTTTPEAGLEDNYLFLPAAGFRTSNASLIDRTNVIGSYWSATPNSANVASCLIFYNIEQTMEDVAVGAYGIDTDLTVRCVK